MAHDMHSILKALLEKATPATSNHYVTRGVGFLAADRPDDVWTVICRQGIFDIAPGIAQARLVIVADSQTFAGLPNLASDTDICFIPQDWRLYLPPPLRPLFNLPSTAPNSAFAMPHRYPVGLSPYQIMAYQPALLPEYHRDALPLLIADAHPEWVAMYDYAWQTAFSNLRQPEPASGFVENFIDTAFNDNSFMWDSCFMTIFGRYARHLFNFMGTLDNFYAKQHADGFICREINTYQGYDLFVVHDPRSTGPNIFAWVEWLDFQLNDDQQRLRDIFPALVGYHRWLRSWRTWPDGSYWTTGLGSGMDNQSRVPDSGAHHRHYTWLDITCQQALNCKILLNIADVIGWHEFDDELHEEYRALEAYINQNLWDEDSGFYFDRSPDGTLSSVMSIGAYWGLLAGIVPELRRERMLAHLDNAAMFNRPHRIPSQSADSTDYRADGSYWLGGVWSPTNYMVLQALTALQKHDLAYQIASNHVAAVANVFMETQTLWENYAPEAMLPGSPARSQFVGWTGISAITIPIEYLIGLRQEAGILHWDIRLTERHGLHHFPLGGHHQADFICEARESVDEPANVKITTPVPLEMFVRVNGHTQSLTLAPGTHHVKVGG